MHKRSHLKLPYSAISSMLQFKMSSHSCTKSNYFQVRPGLHQKEIRKVCFVMTHRIENLTEKHTAYHSFMSLSSKINKSV